MSFEPLRPIDIQRCLYTQRLGRRLFYYPSVDSTNTIATALARAGEAEGTVVYTDHQRVGRGRGDNVWNSPPGKDILLSIVLKPEMSAPDALALTLALSVGLSVAISKTIGEEVAVKWPNDLYVGERKLAGILAEGASASGQSVYAVVGVGLNTNSVPEEFPEEIRERSTSCRVVRGVEVDRALLFADILGTIETFYGRFAKEGFAPFVSMYDDRHMLDGRTVQFSRGGTMRRAQVVGVDRSGALRVAVAGAETPELLTSEIIEVLE